MSSTTDRNGGPQGTFGPVTRTFGPVTRTFGPQGTFGPVTRTFGPQGTFGPEQHRDGAEAFRRHFVVPSRKPDQELLETVLRAFSRLPYENISKIIKHHLATDPISKLRLPGEVMDDHVRFGLGGTCFSLTFFLETILVHAGFRCYPVLADMRVGPARHCALVVYLGGARFLVDPGYVLDRPMEMGPDQPRLCHSGHSGVELVRRTEAGVDTVDLYTFTRDEKKWRYRFVDRPVAPAEFLRHWLDSFSWNSMHGLCLTRVEKDRLVYIHNTHMRETTFGGSRNSNIRYRVHQTIRDVFGIDPDRVESALASLEANRMRERASGLWVPKQREPSSVPAG